MHSAGVQKHGMDNGWRLSLGLAIVPAAIFTIGSFFCPDTPASTLYLDPTAIDRARRVRCSCPLLLLQRVNVEAACSYLSRARHAMQHLLFLGLNKFLFFVKELSAALWAVCSSVEPQTEPPQWGSSGIILECCAAQTLVKMRGTDKVDEELCHIQANLADMRNDSLLSSARTLFSWAHWKQALACVAIPFFQQFTGMNAIMVRSLLMPSLL
jgi:hypothetical protein